MKKPPSGNLALKNQQNQQKIFDSQGAELTKEQLAKRQALSAVQQRPQSKGKQSQALNNSGVIQGSGPVI